LYLLPERRRLHRDRPIVGVTVRVRDLAAAARVLRQAGATFTASPGFLLLPPALAGGLWIELRSQSGYRRR
jgi:hypothetical protein